MKKILIFTENFDVGGVTSVIRAIYDNIDKSKYTLDFARNEVNINDFDKQILQDGNRIYYFRKSPIGRIPVLNYIIFRHDVAKQVLRQIKGEKYDCIYIHANAIIGLYIGVRAKIPVRIMHVHEAVSDFGTGIYESKITDLIWKWRQKKYNKWATVKAGDSMNACKAKFGENVVNDRNVIVLHPPVDFDKFDKGKYDRAEIVKEFNIDESALNLIHTGRLSPVKNQGFLIDVLAEINRSKKANLYVVGYGPLKDELLKKAEKLGVSEKLFFLSPDTTAGIYTAMDYSLLPSITEAFGMVAVESQAMGVPCFASDNVPNDVDCGMCRFLPIDKGTEIWADGILNYEKTELKTAKLKEFSTEYLVKSVEKIFENTVCY